MKKKLIIFGLIGIALLSMGALEVRKIVLERVYESELDYAVGEQGQLVFVEDSTDAPLRVFDGMTTGGVAVAGVSLLDGYIGTNHSGSVHVGTAEGDNFVMGYLADGEGQNTSVLMGQQAGKDSIGKLNFYLGYQSGQRMEGDANTAIGRGALMDASGDDNIVLGKGAGRNLDGNNNMIFGYGAGSGYSRTTNCTMVGQWAGVRAYDKNNQLYIHQHATEPSFAHDPESSFIWYDGTNEEGYLGSTLGPTHIRGTAVDINGTPAGTMFGEDAADYVAVAGDTMEGDLLGGDNDATGFGTVEADTLSSGDGDITYDGANDRFTFQSGTNTLHLNF